MRKQEQINSERWTLHLPSWGEANGVSLGFSFHYAPFASPQDGKCKVRSCFPSHGMNLWKALFANGLTVRGQHTKFQLRYDQASTKKCQPFDRKQKKCHVRYDAQDSVTDNFPPKNDQKQDITVLFLYKSGRFYSLKQTACGISAVILFLQVQYEWKLLVIYFKV